MLAETMINKKNQKLKFLGKSNLEAPRTCVLRNLLELHMHFNEYNEVKSSTVTVGYDEGVTDMIKFHPVMMKHLRGQSNQWD